MGIGVNFHFARIFLRPVCTYNRNEKGKIQFSRKIKFDIIGYDDDEKIKANVLCDSREANILLERSLPLLCCVCVCMCT